MTLLALWLSSHATATAGSRCSWSSTAVGAAAFAAPPPPPAFLDLASTSLSGRVSSAAPLVVPGPTVKSTYVHAGADSETAGLDKNRRKPIIFHDQAHRHPVLYCTH